MELVMSARNIKMLSDGFYSTNNLFDALHWAISVSGNESCLYSVVYSYSNEYEKFIYYIERGSAFIRINESLISEYQNGEKVW